MSNAPVDPDTPQNEEDADESTRILNIGALHLHSNEIDSLNRLAATDPELARIVVEQKEGFDKREHGSYRFGIVAASLLAITVLISLSFILIMLGIVASLVIVSGVMVAALMIRVILTGEWSETSWIGQIVSGIVTLLGGKPKD